MKKSSLETKKTLSLQAQTVRALADVTLVHVVGGLYMRKAGGSGDGC
jgi:hypothetical protein